MKELRITKYWSEYFGINLEEMNSEGISVIPHKSLEGYNGAWLFIRKKRIIISTKPKDLLVIKEKTREEPPNENSLFSEQYINYLFGQSVTKIIGPVFQGFYDSIEPNGTSSKNIKQINFEDNLQEINEIYKTGDLNGWGNSGIDKHKSTIYGYYRNGKILSIANYKILEGNVGFLGIYTNPEFRGKGLGQELINKVISDLSTKGKLVLYQTLFANYPSIGIANKLGIKEFGRNIAIRLK